MMSLTVSVASSTVSKTPSSVRYGRPGCAVSRTETLVTIAERALAADEHAGQVVAGRVLGRRRRTATTRRRAARASTPSDVVDGDAVLERVRPAGVRGHVAADRAGPLARRVGGVVIAAALSWRWSGQVDDARLDDGVAVAGVDFEDPLHAREGDHHAAADRQAAAGQARARAARDERHVRARAAAHDLRPPARSIGEDDDVGPLFSMV